MQYEEMAKYHETFPTQRMVSLIFIKINSYTNHDSYDDQKPSKFTEFTWHNADVHFSESQKRFFPTKTILCEFLKVQLHFRGYILIENSHVHVEIHPQQQ